MTNLTSLIKNTDIEELSLVSVGMNNKTATSLFKAITVRSTLKKLNISSKESSLKNKITAEGIVNLRTVLNH